MLNRDKNRKMTGGVYCSIFLLMLALNVLTPYIADDFRYLFSFYDKTQRIERISDVILSMRAHRYNMNGRLVAHALVQLLGMLPKWVFDVINSVAFVLQTALIHKLAKSDYTRSNLMPLAVFCGIWLFCPAFGQVILWQDGACNYLWSTVLALLYLNFFVETYLWDKPIKTKLGKICFFGLSFVMGAYSETASAAAIFMAALLVVPMLFSRRRKCNPLWIVSLVIAFVGYITIYLAPAQWREKSAEMTLPSLTANFLNVAQWYWNLFGVLICVFALLLALNLYRKTRWETVYLALVFQAGSLAANFIMMFAQYYTTRSATGAFMYLLTAVAILVYPLLGSIRWRRLLAVCLVLLVLVTVPSLISGTKDVYNTYCQMRENEDVIYESREQGVLDIQLPLITCKTGYSVASGGMRYLDTEDPTTWPNDSMTRYYEVDSLIGVTVE